MAPKPPPSIDRRIDQDLAHVALGISPARNPPPPPVGTLEGTLQQIFGLGAVPAGQQPGHREEAA
jgi:hypothetical protein